MTRLAELKQRLLVERSSLTIQLLLQPSVSGVTVFLLVSGLTVDNFSTLCPSIHIRLLVETVRTQLLLHNRIEKHIVENIQSNVNKLDRITFWW